MANGGRHLFPAPIVRLEGVSLNPYALGVATARTCYSGKGVVRPEDVLATESSRAQGDRIAMTTRQAGHLTTRQHAHFIFSLEKVSRQFIWSFLHSHPFYNSEQVSQRYVRVEADHVATPPLHPPQETVFRETVACQMRAYESLIERLLPAVRKEYYQLFPTRARDPNKYDKSLMKKAYEIARYVLPVATHAHLYHTISALTLMRYHRLSRSFDTPLEQGVVVQKMVEEVCKVDPDFVKDLEDPIPLEETVEYRFFEEARTGGVERSRKFVKEFDDSLAGHVSRLIDYKVHAESTVADAVRQVLGLTGDRLPDDDAIELVLSPAKNLELGETLNVTTLSKLSRALVHAHYTFRKKLSHTADSQDQRHRTTPASRPILFAHYTGKPDYIVPRLMQQCPKSLDLYDETMQTTFAAINALLNDGVEPEFALYLLPNAFPIRFEESGDLLNLHHKWRLRACYNAQEEIFFATVEELRQVMEIHPRLARHILAPCYLRLKANKRPYCPEGDRYCGVPVWKKVLGEYDRIL